MQLPAPLRIWPSAQFDSRIFERIAARFVALKTRVDTDWVLGSLGWTLLVYTIVHFGGGMS